MRKRLAAASAVAVVGLLALPSAAWANMGPPAGILAFGLTVVAVLEVGIVVVETPVLKRSLSIGWGKAVLASIASNLVSGIAGLPVAFIAVFLILSSLIEWPLVKAVTRRSWREAAKGVVVANLVSHSLMLAIAVVAAVWPGV